MRRRSAVLLSLLVVLLTLTAGVPAPTAAHLEDQADYHVRLAESGDATITHRLTYDRSNESQNRTFRELLTNETAKAAFASRYENETVARAENASDATGREMSIERVTVVVSEADDVGVVTVTVSWTGLAAVEDDRVVVTEPFASGYHPGVPVTVTAPGGYEVATARPEPTERTASAATWGANASLEGFEFAAERSEGNGGGDLVEVRTEEDGPGFGPVGGLAALTTVGLWFVRRRWCP